jgi:hypothetical protein
VGVAGGVFAPGHLGELTRIIPFEMVDEVLAETRALERRVRLVPARVTVYLLLAAALFIGLGYRQVFDRLCAGLAGLSPVRPSGSALRQARQRLGPAPMKALFDLVSGPAATAATAGRWRGLRVVAVDGTLLPVPDCPANLAVFTRHRLGNGTSGYPQLRLAALVACGTRSLIGSVFGPATTGELDYARRLAVHLRAGMLLLGDRNFAATDATDATDSVAGIDPDRAGFLTALAAARDQLILAAGVITGTDIDLVGSIGRHVLAHLLPARRVRTKDRIVKRAISKYNARGPAIDRTTYKATISINMMMGSP